MRHVIETLSGWSIWEGNPSVMALHVVERCASAVAACAVVLLLVIRLLLRLSELSVLGRVWAHHWRNPDGLSSFMLYVLVYPLDKHAPLGSTYRDCPRMPDEPENTRKSPNISVCYVRDRLFGRFHCCCWEGQDIQLRLSCLLKKNLPMLERIIVWK